MSPARKSNTFCERVLRVVAAIPRGKTLSYSEVARRAGRPRAYRAVGSILRRNKNSAVPCHRVILSDGSVGGYNRGTAQKVRRLYEEGVSVRRR